IMRRNDTTVTEFILLGFTDQPRLRIPLFLLFLLIYLATLVENLGMIFLIRNDSRLHTPMYFFISNLSLLDVAYSTVIAPKMRIALVTDRKTIPFNECAVQFFCCCFAVSTECYLLAPLLYVVIMSRRLCILLVVGSYACGFLNSLIQSCFIFYLSFCSSNVINHFFCDVPPLLKLSCSDTHTTHVVHFTLSTIVVSSTTLTILISYIFILATIFRINSSSSQHKTFSTCAFHLTAVTIFYGTGAFMYVRPYSHFAMAQDKIISVFYTLLIPMLNPLIYSLRNREVKDALKRISQKTCPT
uniref:G-protein coupled receptors family 1 profile domain-containing protein n=1 Tax=Anolis carolinensis TaxID=28377 RepID=A0A803TLN9_ANOCA